MTGRLIHSPRAWARYHQQSEIQFFIYVEGKAYDRSYYEQVLRSEFARSGIKYAFQLSRNISSVTGGEGKQALLGGRDKLEAMNALRTDFRGKKTSVLFFVDKDVDDITGIMAPRPSLTYTSFYNVENHIVVETDLGRAIALAASADPAEIERKLGDPELWKKSAALTQKKWIIACVAAQMFGIRCPNYGAFSLVNVSTSGRHSPSKWKNHCSLMQSRSATSKAALNRKLKTSEDLVNFLFENNRYDEVFKGKWYAPFLEQLADKLVGRANYDRVSFSHAIWISMIAQLDNTSRSSTRFRDIVASEVRWLHE